MMGMIKTTLREHRLCHGPEDDSRQMTQDRALLHRNSGFTLVELIVSVTITGIIMIGLSVFFASSFHNIFRIQNQLSSTQGQLTTNENLKNKLGDIEGVIDPKPFSGTPSEIVTQNKIARKQLPFSYIGKSGDKLVFKDFFIFNGMYEDKESSDYLAGNKNPAGITKIDSTYYVVSPMEDTIYSCDVPFTCSAFITTGLKHPTDITTDGDNLFISDSGNNRVVKYDISETSILPLAKGLNFPTGLAFDGENAQLFVSDTYNNRVIKIDTSLAVGSYPLNESQIITVAGDGDDEDCDNTAKLCKLNFPTGLAIDTGNKNLYIADTGNGRILKTSDPSTTVDLSSYPITFTLSNTQVSKIEFKFPNGTDLSAVPEPSGFHVGKTSKVGSTLKYFLFVPIVNGDATLEDCNVDQGNPCNYYFERFKVNIANDIFITNDNIDLGDTYTIKDGAHAEDPVGINNVFVITPPQNKVSYPPGTIARITNLFNGDYTFNFDLTTAFSAGTFNKITTEVYDGNGDLIESATSDQILRVGNDVIGTLEDTIEVVSDSLTYPTGLGWNGSLHTYTYSKNFSSFDYTSDFDLSATNGLTFSMPNTGLLQMDIETDVGDNYIINVAF